MKALKPREAAVFAGLADAYCSPGSVLPPVAQTSAVTFMDDLVAHSGRVNRIGFRLILRLIDLAPLAGAQRARFTRLSAAGRTEFVHALDRSRWTIVRILGRLLKTVSVMSYYGDEAVQHASGFDPQAIVARGRALRSEEGRL